MGDPTAATHIGDSTSATHIGDRTSATPHGQPHIITEAQLQELTKECYFSLDLGDGDLGVVITLSPPGIVHQVLGLLPTPLTIPPDINPPPAVPLQQGANAATSVINFMRWLDELAVGATRGGGDPLVQTFDGHCLEGYFHKMRVEEHANS